MNNMRIQIRQLSASASEAGIGAHHVVIDRPVAKGGGNAGPMGGELFLAAIGGCFMSNLLAAVQTRKAAVSDVRVEVVGSLADSPVRFSGVEVQVAAKCNDSELLEHLVGIADRGCIMMNTLRGKLDVQVRIATAA